MCRESLVRFQPGWASISRRIHFRSFASNVRLCTYNDSIFGSHYTERNSETSKKSRLAKNLEFYPALPSRNVQTAEREHSRQSARILAPCRNAGQAGASQTPESKLPEPPLV